MSAPSPLPTRSPVAVRGAEVRSGASVLCSRPAITLVLLALALLVVRLVPAAGFLFAPLSWASMATSSQAAPPPLAPTTMAIGETTIEQESGSRSELAQPEQVVAPRAPRGPIANSRGQEPLALPDIHAEAPPIPLLDPSGRALTGFYAALEATQRRKEHAITRIAHFGDSVIVSDFVSGTLRRRLQDQFGDAGHGYVLLAGAWPAYHHNDVYRWASSGWRVSRIVGPLAPDGFYGLGGVSFQGPPGTRARVGTSKDTKRGRSVSRFELHYLSQPGSCEFTINIDGEHVTDFSMAGEAVTFETRSFDVEDGEHEFEVVSRKGLCRAFGIVLERERPGIVLDALGVQGARIRFLDKQDDQHWAQVLKARRPDLLVYQFGANESADGFAYPMEDYRRTMAAVIKQGQEALPKAGCLVVGAMDRARKEGEVLVSLPIMKHLQKAQRETALETGCAFFDTREAMGGAGSMARWVRRGLARSDYTHPSGYGAEVLGNWLYGALMGGYRDYLARRRDE